VNSSSVLFHFPSLLYLLYFADTRLKHDVLSRFQILLYCRDTTRSDDNCGLYW